MSAENHGGHSSSIDLPPESTQPRIRQDQVHAQSSSSPHIPIDQLHAKSKRNSNWQSAVGQVMAYFGVGILTVGTVVVLIGYFGGPPNYAPTGWLITIFGQMLLFIGVITLVSGGMEQTTLEVARRIDALSAQLQRLEQASRDPLPPSSKLPPGAYTGETLGRSCIDQRESLKQ
jgi:sulfite exporter TauE/SafE